MVTKQSNNQWDYILNNVGAVGPVTRKRKWFGPDYYFFNVITNGFVMSLTFLHEQEAEEDREEMLNAIRKIKNG